MNRKEFMQGCGGLLAGAFLPIEIDYPKVGDILEVTVSWSDDWKTATLHHSFMGQEFSNGETKRFKLLEEYEIKRGACDCYHCKMFENLNSEDWRECIYDTGMNWGGYCYPVFQRIEDCKKDRNGAWRSKNEEDPTFHMFLDGRKSGSFTDPFETTVKWNTVQDDGTPYHAEKTIVNPQRFMHT